MKFFDNFRRKRAIRSYLKRLPKLLKRGYGKKSAYTPKQVQSAIKRHHLSSFAIGYAIVIFSDRSGFEQYQRETDQAGDYDSMRSDVAIAHFDGNIDFSAADIDTVSTSFGFDLGDLGGDMSAADSGGGFDGGD